MALKYLSSDVYDFNPRSPSGLRRHNVSVPYNGLEFQSTQPEWAATFRLIAYIIGQVLFQSTQPEWAATGIVHYLH